MAWEAFVGGGGSVGRHTTWPWCYYASPLGYVLCGWAVASAANEGGVVVKTESGLVRPFSVILIQ